MACTTCTYIIQATILLKSISMWDQKSKRRIPHILPKIDELVFLFGDGEVGELVFLLGDGKVGELVFLLGHGEVDKFSFLVVFCPNLSVDLDELPLPLPIPVHVRSRELVPVRVGEDALALLEPGLPGAIVPAVTI